MYLGNLLLTSFITFFHLSVVIFLLLRNSGNIHPNPGPQTLNVCHANVRSMRAQSKLDEIKNMATVNNIDVITLSETWLSTIDNDNSLKLSGYHNIIRNDRTSQIGGGVAIYCADHINVTVREDLLSNTLPTDCSHLWVEIYLNHFKLLIGTYYRPPGQSAVNRDAFIDSLSYSIAKAVESNCTVIFITGDFNDRCEEWNSSHSESELVTRLVNLIQSSGLSQLVNTPTRITDTSRSLLDLFITDCPNIINDITLLPPVSTSDHSVVLCKVKAPILKSARYKRVVWEYDFLRNAPFDVGYDMFNDVEDVVEYWIQLYKSTLQGYIPYKSVSIKSNDKPWITQEFKKLIRKRNRLWKRFKHTENPADYQAYKKVRNAAVSLNRNNIKQYHANIELQMSNSCSSKVWWQNVKKIISTKHSHSIPPIQKNNILVNNDTEKATVFNEYFIEQCKLPPGADNHTLPLFTPQAENVLDIPHLRDGDILNILKSLPCGKATGPDGIGNRILASTAVSIFRPLCKLFNFCLSRQTFPSCWKVANVTPVHKKESKTYCNNYRPISLLSNISKVFERAIYNIVNSYLTGNKLLNPKNAGFKKGDSTVNQLLYITDKIAANLDQGKEVRMVFLDAAKAFDKVWHKGLLFKLRQIGLSQNFVSWFTSYLTGRRQRVVINGASSPLLPIEAGVPQGSILGPLLFLVHVNDITDNLATDANLFADDTSLLEIVADPVLSAKRLNNDLSNLSIWAKQWLVSFNPSKTEVLTFTNKRNPPNHPVLYLDGNPLREVDTHIHLGLTLTRSLSWSKHIQKIVCKASQRINIMRHLKYLLGRKTLINYSHRYPVTILFLSCLFVCYSHRSPVTIISLISLISLMRQNPFRDHISETELVSHIVTINVR